MLRYSVAALAVLAGLTLVLVLRSPPDAAQADEALAHRLLAAVADKDYAEFVALSDRNVRKLSRDDFASLVARQASRLHAFPTLARLAEHWRGDVHVTRWRVGFRDGGTAVLTLGVRDGRVASFAIY